MSKKKDIELIEKLKLDVKGSYAVLYREYFGMIRHLIQSNGGTADDAADIFQDAVIALFEMIKRKDFELKSALSTLIYSISRNLWLKRLRDNQKAQSFQDCEKYIPVEMEEEDSQRNDLLDKMEGLVRQMGDPCKTILIGFYFLKKKMAEIADELQYKSADHAKAQKYKCIQRLKKSIS